MATLELSVNGAKHTVDVRDPDEPLLYVLRNRLGLTGAKFGCGLGQCGACMVLVDGAAVPSCQLAATKAVGKKITTIEGLGTASNPHRLQAAFVAEQASQCGYCITGMIMAAAALLDTRPEPNEAEVKAALAGNLCRCGTHERIVNAVVRAAGKA